MDTDDLQRERDKALEAADNGDENWFRLRAFAAECNARLKGALDLEGIDTQGRVI